MKSVSSNPALEEVEFNMKKFRSNLPRRKRTRFSPIFVPSIALNDADSSSNLTRDVAFSCDSSSVLSTNNKSLKKRSFSGENGAESGELSESSSCVDQLCNSSSKNFFGIENSEVTTRSECSVIQKPLTNVRDNDAVSVSVSSRRDSPQAKFETTSCFKLLSDAAINETEADNCGESKLNLADFDLTCSEQFSESDYSSAGCTDAIMESSEIEISSDFTTLSWYDSGSQFSERSVGDPAPSPTFQLFLVYRQKFCKSEFSTKVASEQNYNKTSDRIIKLLRREDEEHEESYQMMKKRERRQVYLHDYAEEYCVMKEYGDLVVQQRLQMVHWIMEQSANKDLQKETMFLGVSLLDRFLSKGYFKSKMELEIAGIACLTLATRIEENQPYNSIQQKLFYVGSTEYSRSEVVAMEWLVQEVLNFQCYLPTIYNFLWFYLKAARSDEGVDKTAKYLAVLALLGHEQLCYWPSTVAASLVSLACLAEKGQSSLQQIAWIHNGSNDKDLPGCIKSLEWLVQYIC